MSIYEVTAPAAVVALATEAESYLYRGARFDSDNVKPAHLDHLESLGFVTKVGDPTAAPEVKPEVKPEPAPEGSEPKASSEPKSAKK